MEVAPGVFLSKAPAGEWEPDTDTPGEVQVLCTGVGMEAGLWRWVPGLAPEPFRWTLPGREVILVLEGTAAIDMDNGSALEVAAGDIASMPKDAVTTWHVSPGYKELWVLAENG